MNKIKTIIIICIFLIYSCKSDSTNYKNFHFKEYDLKIKIPMNFNYINQQEIKKFYDLGTKTIKENGYESNIQQNNILFLKKGEFSSIVIKYNPINDEIAEDYKSQWRNLKKMTFDILQKEKMQESEIDSTSRIEKINGIDFYVFETNINLSDLNNNKATFKSIRYSTPLHRLDLVINIKYANQVDEKDILETIESIKINKR